MTVMGKTLFVVAAMSLMSIVPAAVHAGACDPSPGAPEERAIDGPANVREAPSSKAAVVASLPDRKKVLVTRHEVVGGKDWYFIEWTDGGKRRSGWTFVNNIVCD